jgi:hypothetical protein
MSPSLRALLSGILDYAGLFPPASLSLDQTVHNYAEYRRGPDAWMLGRFMCPVGRLTELASLGGAFAATERPWSLSILGRGGNTVDELVTATEDDLAAIASFEQEQRGRFAVTALEVRWPPQTLVAWQAAEAQHQRAQALASLVHRLIDQELAWYIELPLGNDWRVSVDALTTTVALLNRFLEGLGQPIGLKIRTGGLEAAAFPTPEQLAFTIVACRDRRVPLKFTAGLHHPIRHFDAGLRTPIHGFLNVFGAGVLAHARDLIEAEVQVVIEDEDASAFQFDGKGFRWRDLYTTVEEIALARRQVVSFGSCSFDEPREDLRALFQQ